MSLFHSLNKVQPPQVTSLDLPPNLSVVLLKKQTISIQPTDTPVLQPDGVMVKIIATGICGSDMHGYNHGGVGGVPVTEPNVMGHESSGEVIAVGDLVKTHKIGDRVAIEPNLACRRCVNCKSGRTNICLDIRYCGTPGTKGTLCRFFTLPADMAPHIPDHISWDEAGSIQPLAVGIQIADRADIRPQQTVAVCGVGPVGLIAAAVAHAYSARKIIGFDINPRRVDFAKSYISPTTGQPIFDHVFLNTPLPSDVPPKEEGALARRLGEAADEPGGGDADRVDAVDSEDLGIEAPTEGDVRWMWAKERAAGWIEESGLADEEGFDRVLECSGADDCGLLGCALAKQGGTYLAVGLGPIVTKMMPMIAVTNKELNVKGITRHSASSFPRAIDLLARRRVDLKQLITRTVPLTRAQEALDAVIAGQDIKVVIKNQE